MNKLKENVFSIIFVLAVAVLGSVFVNIGIEWFNSLIKPSQWIPNIVIPIVWTIIYISFAVVNFRWQKKGDIPKNIVILMVINGFLNVLWCLIFFTFKLTFVGNIVIVLNLIFGILLWVEISKVERIYSYVLSIYPIWLSIATTLNLALWILN